MVVFCFLDIRCYDGFLCSNAEPKLNMFEIGSILQVLMFVLLFLIAVSDLFNMSINGLSSMAMKMYGQTGRVLRRYSLFTLIDDVCLCHAQSTICAKASR